MQSVWQCRVCNNAECNNAECNSAECNNNAECNSAECNSAECVTMQSVTMQSVTVQRQQKAGCMQPWFYACTSAQRKHATRNILPRVLQWHARSRKKTRTLQRKDARSRENTHAPEKTRTLQRIQHTPEKIRTLRRTYAHFRENTHAPENIRTLQRKYARSGEHTHAPEKTRTLQIKHARSRENNHTPENIRTLQRKHTHSRENSTQHLPCMQQKLWWAYMLKENDTYAQICGVRQSPKTFKYETSWCKFIRKSAFINPILTWHVSTNSGDRS